MKLLALIILFAGYICGILFKITGNADKIILLYILNGTMVFVDIMIFLRNKKIEKL